jgi:hypothetical protein
LVTTASSGTTSSFHLVTTARSGKTTARSGRTSSFYLVTTASSGTTSSFHLATTARSGTTSSIDFDLRHDGNKDDAVVFVPDDERFLAP